MHCISPNSEVVLRIKLARCPNRPNTQLTGTSVYILVRVPVTFPGLYIESVEFWFGFNCFKTQRRLYK
jgi:hypothetical protein